MRKTALKLNDEVSIDLQKLIVSKLLAVANSGGGKSWLVRRIIEQAYGHVPIIVLDPEGEFSTLREKYDFVLCGKGMDAPAEPRSAALLARKLLETRTSAVIDLYELHPQERKHFVRLFLDSMVNAPKDLYNDCLIILDEAHRFAPEKEEAESSSAVIEMASLGRKRGFCLVLATQRISKLSKDAAAECNNKLIGRTSLDIDRKRAADELGITKKEDILAMRNLAPGEFFAFGPAISDEVIKLKVGGVETTIPRAGRQTKVAPPSTKLKQELAALADLPAEAEKEAKTTAELHQQVTELKRQLATRQREDARKPAPVDLKEALAPHITAIETERAATKKLIAQWVEFIRMVVRLACSNAEELIKAMKDIEKQMPPIKPAAVYTPKPAIRYRGSESDPPPPVMPPPRIEPMPVSSPTDRAMGKGERAILIACAQHDGCTREHLTVLTGYKRSSRDAYLQRLQGRGYIEDRSGDMCATEAGIVALGDDYEPLPTGADLREHLMRTLPEGEKRVLSLLMVNYPTPIEREQISQEVGYQRSSRDAYLQRLKARHLIELVGRGMVKASDKLF